MIEPFKSITPCFVCAGDGAGDPGPAEVGPGGGDPLLLPGAPPAHDGRHRDRGRGRGAREGQEDRRDHHHPLRHGVQVQQYRQSVEINIFIYIYSIFSL